MVNEDEDIPNWILDDSFVLSQKVTNIFLLLGYGMCGLRELNLVG